MIILGNVIKQIKYSQDYIFKELVQCPAEYYIKSMMQMKSSQS